MVVVAQGEPGPQLACCAKDDADATNKPLPNKCELLENDFIKSSFLFR
jgi:hypothetical protein